MTRRRKITDTQIQSTVPGVRCRMHNGSWTIFLAAGLTPANKRKALSLHTTDPQAAVKGLELTEAELVIDRRAVRELTIAGSREREGVTVRQAVELYLADAHARLGADSVALHRLMLTQWVLPSPLADLPIVAVRPKGVKDLLRTVRTTKNRFRRFNSRATAATVLTAIRSLFEWTRSEEVLVDRDGRTLANPASKLSAATKHTEQDDAVEERVRPFSRDEQAALLKAASSEWVRVFLHIGLRAGLRIGEILALQFDDFNFATNTLRISRRWTPARGVLPGVKNRRAGKRMPFREVPFNISAELPVAVREQIERRRKQNEEKGWSASPWMFVTRDGGVWHRSNFHAKVWRPLLKRAGVGPHVFHDTRHTFASELLLATNGNVDYVARCLGDRMAIVANVYCHVIEGLAPGFAGALDFNRAPAAAAMLHDAGNVIQLDARRRSS